MRITVAVAALPLAALAAPAAADSPEDRAQERPLLLMHYMPWYETADVRGNWGGHWTGWQKQHNPENTNDAGLPDIWSNLHPLIGTYDSTDADVVECHLLQMKLAGVDGVIADWYGISDVYDYPAIHDATKVLFDQSVEHGMQFSVCYEDRTIEGVEKQGKAPGGVAAHLEEMYDWLSANWFTSSNYTTFNGRPLVLNFGPIYAKDPADWQAALDGADTRPAMFALQHLWREAGVDGGFTWVHANIWEGDPDAATIEKRVRETFALPSSNPDEAIVSAIAGFKDVYKEGGAYPVIEHRDGKTLDEQLSVAMEGPWQICQLVTWNDYGEGTCIEPTHEFGYTFLEVIQRHVRDAEGGSFSFTPDDLRLPAELLEARRAGNAPKSALDRVASLIAEGKVAAARRLLTSLEQ